jgi:hypothetical protein
MIPTCYNCIVPDWTGKRQGNMGLLWDISWGWGFRTDSIEPFQWFRNEGSSLRGGNEGSPRIDPHLSHDVPDVVLDGLFAYEEPFRNCLVGEALHV